MTTDPLSTAPADALLRIPDAVTALAITSRLVAQARRGLWMRVLGLETWLLEDPDILTALRTLATSGRDVQIRLLLLDITPAPDAPGRFIALAQRLPSVFQFRHIDDPAHREDRSALIVNDAGGYYLRPHGDAIEGSACLADRSRTRQLLQGFEDAWQHAQPITEYRALGI